MASVPCSLWKSSVLPSQTGTPIPPKDCQPTETTLLEVRAEDGPACACPPAMHKIRERMNDRMKANFILCRRRFFMGDLSGEKKCQKVLRTFAGCHFAQWAK